MKTYRVVILYPIEKMPALNAAARAAGVDRSKFIVQMVLENLESERMAAKLLQSARFRSVISRLVTEPEVMVDVAKLSSTPANRKKVRAQVESEMERMSRGARRPGNKRGQAKG